MKNCGGNCTHTDAEHEAFDLGVDWGRAQGLAAVCPFRDLARAKAFEDGKSVGAKAHVNEWPPVNAGVVGEEELRDLKDGSDVKKTEGGSVT